MNYLIGIDIGTQGTKAVLISDSGVCSARAFAPSKLIRPSRGTVEEDPEEQLRSAVTTIKECLKQSGVPASAVEGLAISGQMAGIIGIGSSGTNITPYDSWLDERCSQYIVKMNEMAGEEILLRTGHAPSFNHGPKILWWKNEREAVYKHIKAFVQPGAYVAMRLCGLKAEDAFIDDTYLHFSGFYNNLRGEWDEELCSMFDIDKGKLPIVVRPEKIIGHLNERAASETGLLQGTKIVAGCGDTAASFLSAGAVDNGICVDVAGTASVFAAATSSFKADIKNKTLGCGKSVINGLWYPYAYINGGGMNLEWLRNMVMGKLLSVDPPDLDMFNSLAGKSAPEYDDPFFIPHLGGRVCPPKPDIRGAWLNLSWTHTGPVLYKAVLESIAFEYRIFKNALTDLYDNYEIAEMRITGGGEKSELWNQMKADILGIKVVQMQQNEGAPLGSAILAGLGTGLITDIRQSVKSWIKIKKEFIPDGSLQRLYNERFGEYVNYIRRLYE